MATEVLSTTRQAISVLGRDYFKPVLKPRGFRTAGVNFWRQEDGLFQSVAFQASMWGDRNAGRFTVNVGVTDPELYEQFTGRVPPKNSSLIRWPISRRVGHLMPEMTDLWWKVDEHADIVALGEEIARPPRGASRTVS